MWRACAPPTTGASTPGRTRCRRSSPASPDRKTISRSPRPNRPRSLATEGTHMTSTTSTKKPKEQPSPRISVIGTGCLGAPHAAAMAELGFDVIGVDTDPHKVAELTEGRAPFFEPGLPELIRANVSAGRLAFTTDIAEAVAVS